MVYVADEAIVHVERMDTGALWMRADQEHLWLTTRQQSRTPISFKHTDTVEW